MKPDKHVELTSKLTRYVDRICNDYYFNVFFHKKFRLHMSLEM